MTSSTSFSSSSSSEKLMCKHVSVPAEENGKVLSMGQAMPAGSLTGFLLAMSPAAGASSEGWQVPDMGEAWPFSPVLSLPHAGRAPWLGNSSVPGAGVLTSDSNSELASEQVVTLVRLDTLGLGSVVGAAFSGLGSTSRLGEVLLDLFRRMAGGGLSLGMGCCNLESTEQRDVRV